MKWYVASLAPEDKEYLCQCHDEDTIRMMLTSRHSTNEIPFRRKVTWNANSLQMLVFPLIQDINEVQEHVERNAI